MKLNKSFLIKDDELLEKYNEIWEKVKISIKKEFDNKPVYNEKYLKAKIKSYNGKINTYFHNNKIPRYLRVLLEECKYFVKEKKIPKYIIDDIETSSDS